MICFLGSRSYRRNDPAEHISLGRSGRDGRFDCNSVVVTRNPFFRGPSPRRVSPLVFRDFRISRIKPVLQPANYDPWL